MGDVKSIDEGKDEATVITEACEAIDRIEAQIAVLRGEISEQKARVKGQGILLANFNAVRRVRKLEGDERTETLAQLRRCFNALLPGQQSEMFPAAKAATAAGGTKH